jgi:DNA-directed RNA polymerase subunit RPC12/RpoP
MASTDSETRTRQGACPEHGEVRAVKEVPKITFPFVITAPARGLAALRPYRCPECGAKVS